MRMAANRPGFRQAKPTSKPNSPKRQRQQVLHAFGAGVVFAIDDVQHAAHWSHAARCARRGAVVTKPISSRLRVEFP